jgi:hypothetical protein
MLLVQALWFLIREDGICTYFNAYKVLIALSHTCSHDLFSKRTNIKEKPFGLGGHVVREMVIGMMKKLQKVYIFTFQFF